MKSVKNRLLLPMLTASLGLIPTNRVAAQTFMTLHNFDYSDGAVPTSVIVSGSKLYGTAPGGGRAGNGTVFAVNIDGSGFTNLYNFTQNNTNSLGVSTNSDGLSPGYVILSGNTLYGIAFYGGTNGYGTVFAVNTNGSGFTILHHFTSGSGSFPYVTNSDGAIPLGLILSSSTLYGTAYGGGTNGTGTVFKINTDGTSFTTLYDFPSATVVGNGTLTLSSNTLYGAEAFSPGYGAGSVFAINTNGTGFTNYLIGGLPNGGLTLSGTTLYGTASQGGSTGNGTVFAINVDGAGFTNLYNFTATSGDGNPFDGGTNNDGALPYAGVILLGNTLYGTTEYGGLTGNGTVFAVNTNGTGFKTLYSFTALSGSNSTNSDGANTQAGLALSGNTLYGTAPQGGIYAYGTVFSFSLGSFTVIPPQLTIIHSGANVILTWPTNTARFILQSTTNLAPPAVWTTNSPAPVVVNTNNVVTNTISGTQRFYRLSQ